MRLQQVLVNLVSNALKFTRQGGVTVRAGLAPEPAAAGHVALRFEVTDTGVGIPMDQLVAIFEDFSQANTSTTREFGSTGLGLSIARNLVRLHGGQLGVSSEEGVGSTFYFELTYPVADPSQAQPGTVAGPLPPSSRPCGCWWPKTTSSTSWWHAKLWKTGTCRSLLPRMAAWPWSR